MYPMNVFDDEAELAPQTLCCLLFIIAQTETTLETLRAEYLSTTGGPTCN